MQVVHLYIEADSTAPRSMSRQVIYVLECEINGEAHTRDEVSSEIGTYHAAILKAMAKALSRINKKCELHIHTQDSYILSSIDQNLKLWAGNGWRTKKGTLLKNHFEWAGIWAHLSQHLVVVESGMHSYYAWMTAEMARRKNAPHSVNTE